MDGSQTPYLCWKPKNGHKLGLFLIKVSKKNDWSKSSNNRLPHKSYVFGHNILISILVWQTLHQHHSDFRREEKLYVEGMEDEDMKKETQNLAYPPAFKVTTPCLATLSSDPFLQVGGRPVCQEAQPVCRRQDLQRSEAKDFWLDASGRHPRHK